jgi:hypothetical protein
LDASCSSRNQKDVTIQGGDNRKLFTAIHNFDGPNIAGYHSKQKGWLPTIIADFVRN